MYLPRLNQLRSDVSAITQFGGYNHNRRITDAEFADMSYMTSDDNPVIGTRNRRGKVRQLTDANGIIAHDHLAWVDGTAFYYNGEEVTGLTLTDSEKQLVVMGAYIVIFPDKKYYNTSDETYGSMEAGAEIDCTQNTLTASLTDLYGQEYTYTKSDTAPELPNDHDYWMDTSVVPNVLKVYIAAQYSWISVPTTYIKIEATGIGSEFEKYDAVTITGSLNGVLDSSYTIYDKANNYIIVMGLIDTAVEQQTGTVTVARTVPDMDYVCELDNRLWGCSSANHEIYASKLGDFKNFNAYQGLSTDSYTVTVGSKGDFTGCIAHLGYVIFFKEDIIHKIYGNKPANFQMNNINARGVKKGSSKSLVIVNETLYYHSLSGVVAMTTSLPESISPQLNDTFENAAAGAYGSKYVISMSKGNKDYTFVYDTERNIWLKDCESRFVQAAKLGDDMYSLDADGTLWSWQGDLETYADENENAELEPVLVYDLETGDLGLDNPYQKYIKKLFIRCELEGAVSISMRFDNDPVWQHMMTIRTEYLRSYNIPIAVRRCDHLRVRFDGSGVFRLFSFARETETGSEIS